MENDKFNNVIDIYKEFSSKYLIDINYLIENDTINKDNIHEHFLSFENNNDHLFSNGKYLMFKDYFNKKKLFTFKFNPPLISTPNTSLISNTPTPTLTPTPTPTPKQRRTLNNIKKLDVNMSERFIKTFNVNVIDIHFDIDIMKYVYKYIYDNYLQDKWKINPDKTLIKFLSPEYINENMLTYKNIHKYILYNV